LIAVYARCWIDGTGVQTVIVEDAKALMNADNRNPLPVKTALHQLRELSTNRPVSRAAGDL
jgi:hypothetical protein